jgi:hypothetical protein
MFDPDAGMPKLNRSLVYLGACIIAGLRLVTSRHGVSRMMWAALGTTRLSWLSQTLRLHLPHSSQVQVDILSAILAVVPNGQLNITSVLHSPRCLATLRRITHPKLWLFTVQSDFASVRQALCDLHSTN